MAAYLHNLFGVLLNRKLICSSLLIYLFLALWGLHCHTHGLFSSCGEQGLLSSCGALASVVVEHIDTWTSRVAAHGL